MNKKKILLISSFWGNPKHVGNYRVERFSRWLIELGFEIFVVNAGFKNSEKLMDGIYVITISDPLKLDLQYREAIENVKLNRKPNHSRRKIAKRIFIPDSHIVWGFRVIRNKRVNELCKDFDYVLSSSPDDSMHVISYILSKRHNIPLLVDMRDGWIDEPIRTELLNSGFRKYIETKVERLILNRAYKIIVTSDKWKEKLITRIPELNSKILVITNAYPILDIPSSSTTYDSILYVGQLKNSGNRKVDELLEPIYNSIIEIKEKLKISFIGEYDKNEMEDIKRWNSMFAKKGWEILVRNRVWRSELLEIMSKSIGFLLISTSDAAIPSKLFEYIILKKPILVVTIADSSVWRICKKLQQAYLVDLKLKDNTKNILQFFNQAISRNSDYTIPEEFYEYNQKLIFNKIFEF